MSDITPTLLTQIGLAMTLSYLFGSIATAVIVAKLMDIPDPRHFGSGNPGATNVLRLGGKKAAVFTLAGDMLKGVLPVACCIALNLPIIVVAAAALAAFIGHLYPVFFGFKGGKGVATAAGVLLAMAPLTGLIVITVWLVNAIITRYSSLSALLAAISAPIVAWLTGQPVEILITITLISALLIWRHQANIQRLLAGQEPKIGQKAN